MDGSIGDQIAGSPFSKWKLKKEAKKIAVSKQDFLFIERAVFYNISGHDQWVYSYIFF